MQHLALIMDGNRRWAKKNGVKNPYDTASQKAVKEAITFCLERGIPYLSLYAFSLENFNRSKAELALLFDLLARTLRGESSDLVAQGVRVRFVGDRSVYPSNIVPLIEHVEAKSAHCTLLNLNILFCYGGQQELVHATKLLAERVQRGVLDPADITEQTLRNVLWTLDTPDPELIVRTSGARRLSNFLTFQSAYSELMFLDCYWPEMSRDKLSVCVDKYEAIKRNFGS